jgi:hypothetical protein
MSTERVAIDPTDELPIVVPIRFGDAQPALGKSFRVCGGQHDGSVNARCWGGQAEDAASQ